MADLYDRLEPAHKLSFLDRLMENPVWQHHLAEQQEAHRRTALFHEDPTAREAARQRYLALEEFAAGLTTLGEQFRDDVRQRPDQS